MDNLLGAGRAAYHFMNDPLRHGIWCLRGQNRTPREQPPNSNPKDVEQDSEPSDKPISETSKKRGRKPSDSVQKRRVKSRSPLLSIPGSFPSPTPSHSSIASCRPSTPSSSHHSSSAPPSSPEIDPFKPAADRIADSLRYPDLAFNYQDGNRDHHLDNKHELYRRLRSHDHYVDLRRRHNSNFPAGVEKTKARGKRVTKAKIDTELRWAIKARMAAPESRFGATEALDSEVRTQVEGEKPDASVEFYESLLRDGPKVKPSFHARTSRRTYKPRTIGTELYGEMFHQWHDSPNRRVTKPKRRPFYGHDGSSSESDDGAPPPAPFDFKRAQNAAKRKAEKDAEAMAKAIQENQKKAEEARKAQKIAEEEKKKAEAQASRLKDQEAQRRKSEESSAAAEIEKARSIRAAAKAARLQAEKELQKDEERRKAKEACKVAEEAGKALKDAQRAEEERKAREQAAVEEAQRLAEVQLEAEEARRKVEATREAQEKEERKIREYAEAQALINAQIAEEERQAEAARRRELEKQKAAKARRKRMEDRDREKKEKQAKLRAHQLKAQCLQRQAETKARSEKEQRRKAEEEAARFRAEEEARKRGLKNEWEGLAAGILKEQKQKEAQRQKEEDDVARKAREEVLKKHWVALQKALGKKQKKQRLEEVKAEEEERLKTKEAKVEERRKAEEMRKAKEEAEKAKNRKPVGLYNHLQSCFSNSVLQCFRRAIDADDLRRRLEEVNDNLREPMEDIFEEASEESQIKACTSKFTTEMNRLKSRIKSLGNQTPPYYVELLRLYENMDRTTKNEFPPLAMQLVFAQHLIDVAHNEVPDEDRYDGFTQQDSSDYVRELLSNLDNDTAGWLKDKFELRNIERRTCSNEECRHQWHSDPDGNSGWTLDVSITEEGDTLENMLAEKATPYGKGVRCPNCGTNAAEAQWIGLQSAPDYVVVKVDRFKLKDDADAFEDLEEVEDNFRKDMRHVEFPLGDLDMTQYFHEGDSKVTYRVISVVRHRGLELSRGHYTAVAEHGGKWWTFDDRVVTQSRDGNAVINEAGTGTGEQVFLAFLRRVD